MTFILSYSDGGLWSLVDPGGQQVSEVLGSEQDSHVCVCVCVSVCVCVCSDSRRRPRLLDGRQRRSSVERWIPEAELVLRLRLA